MCIEIESLIHTVLIEAHPALQRLRDEWFVIGASALILAGIDIEHTSDIDLLVSERDAEFLRGEWKTRMIDMTTTKGSNLFRSFFSRFHFGKMDVEIMGDLHVNQDGVWIPVSIRESQAVLIRDFEIKIPTLPEQERILRLFGREKDMEKVTRIIR